MPIIANQSQCLQIHPPLIAAMPRTPTTRTFADVLGLEESWELEIPLKPAEVAARLRSHIGYKMWSRSKIVFNGSVGEDSFNLRVARKQKVLSVFVVGHIDETDLGSRLTCRIGPSDFGIALYGLIIVATVIGTAVAAVRATVIGNWEAPVVWAFIMTLFLVLPLFIGWDVASHKRAICQVLGIDPPPKTLMK